MAVGFSPVLKRTSSRLWQLELLARIGIVLSMWGIPEIKPFGRRIPSRWVPLPRRGSRPPELTDASWAMESFFFHSTHPASPAFLRFAHYLAAESEPSFLRHR